MGCPGLLFTAGSPITVDRASRGPQSLWAKTTQAGYLWCDLSVLLSYLLIFIGYRLVDRHDKSALEAFVKNNGDVVDQKPDGM